MIDARFRPLETPLYRPRKRAPFRAGWNQTLDLLEAELHHLGAKDIIVQAGFQLSEIRNDGWPRSGRRPSHPAVILSFRDSNGTPLSFPCDTYDNHEDNLRAIALSLQALRAVNRYGVTKGHEQYRGFAQLPAADPNARRMEAISFLQRVTGAPWALIVNDIQGTYRMAARAVHPDHGGTDEKFHELQRHMEALR